MSGRWRRWLPWAVLPALAGMIVLAFWCLRVRVNFTPSLPKGLYQLAPGAPQRGDLVSFCLPEGIYADMARQRGYLAGGSCPSGLRPLLKVLAGLPGDLVAVDAAGIRIREAGRPDTAVSCFWPASAAKAFDNKGRSMPSILEPGVIPAGKALVLAQHPGSFDSRYFGLVDLRALTRVQTFYLF